MLNLLPLVIPLILPGVSRICSSTVGVALPASIVDAGLGYVLGRARIWLWIVALAVTGWLNFALAWYLTVLQAMALASRVMTRGLSIPAFVLTRRDIHLIGGIHVRAAVQVRVWGSPWCFLDLACCKLFKVGYAGLESLNTLLLPSVSISVSSRLSVNILALRRWWPSYNLRLGILLACWWVALVVSVAAPARIVSFSHVRKYWFLRGIIWKLKLIWNLKSPL